MSTYQGKKGKAAWLRELAVDPKYQYQGIAGLWPRLDLNGAKAKEHN